MNAFRLPSRQTMRRRVAPSLTLLAACCALTLPAAAWAGGGNSTKQAPGAGQAVTASGAARSDYRFAVKDFHVADTVYYPNWENFQPQLDNAVCDMLTTEMSKQGRDMVERSRLEDVTTEQDLGASGRLDKSTAAPIGKILGADYLILGTITEWGIKERSIGGSGIFGGMFGGASLSDKTARVKIDYRVVNAKTSRIVSGSAGTAEGDEETKGVALATNWWTGINFSESDWTSSQIGKATRKAVQQIAKQLSDWTPNDGGAEAERSPVQGSVVALVSTSEFVIDKGSDDDVRVGDAMDVMSIKEIKNSAGKVVYQTKTKIGSAQVVEVQSGGARLRMVSQDTIQGKLAEGDGVCTSAPASVPSPSPDPAPATGTH